MYFPIRHTPLLCNNSVLPFHMQTHISWWYTATKVSIRVSEFESWVISRRQYKISRKNCWFFQMTRINFNARNNFKVLEIYHFTWTVSRTVNYTCDALYFMTSPPRHGSQLKRWYSSAFEALLSISNRIDTSGSRHHNGIMRLGIPNKEKPDLGVLHYNVQDLLDAWLLITNAARYLWRK